MPPQLSRSLSPAKRRPISAFRLKTVYDVWICFAFLAALDALIVWLPHETNAVRLGLGLAVGLFVPGYLSTLALFPDHETLDSIERTGLSLVLSVVWIPLLALLLSLAHIRLNAEHVVLSISLVSLLMGFMGVWRRSLSGVESPPPVYPNGAARFYLGGLVLALGIVTWAIVAPNLKAQHLAFSVLGAHNQLQGYPYQIAVGQKYPLHLQIYNPASITRQFTVRMVANGTRPASFTATVKSDQTWQHTIILPANPPARSETARFLLLPQGGHKILRTLWIRYTIVS